MISFAITYAGAAFAPKIKVTGRCGFLACLDLQVTVDDIQGVQLLTFVLMKTFDLDIINTVCVDLLTCVGFDKLRTSLLCILFDLKDIGKNVLISLNPSILSSSKESLRKPSPIMDVMYSVNGWLQ